MTTPDQPQDPQAPDAAHTYPPYDDQTVAHGAPVDYADDQSTGLVAAPAHAESAIKRWKGIAALAVGAAALTIIGFFLFGQQGRGAKAAPVTSTVTQTTELPGEEITRTQTTTVTQERDAVTQTERETQVRTETVTATTTVRTTVTRTVEVEVEGDPDATE